MSTGNELVTLKQVDNYYKDLRKRSAPVIFNSAIGNPAVFSDGADGLPIQSLKVHLLPRQEGTGDPSPQNIRSIVPWNGLMVFGGGENLLDEENVPAANRYIKYTSPTNAQWAASQDSRSYKLEVEPNTTYTIRAMNPAIATFRVCALENGDLLEQSTNAFQWNGTGERVCTITTSAMEHYLIIQANRSVLIDRKGYIFVGKGTASDNPINEADITFPSPIYGGIPDVVRGKMVVNYIRYDLIGDNVLAYGTASTGVPYVRAAISSIMKTNGVLLAEKYPTVTSAPSQGSTGVRINNGDNLYVYDETFTSQDVAKGILNTNPVAIVYELATPYEVDIDSSVLMSLYGINTIRSDANGDIEVEYRADTGLFLKRNTVKDVQMNGTSINQNGIANIPKAGDSTLGVVKGRYYGVRINNDGDMYISTASESEVKAGSSNYLPIVPSNQHKSAFYALAKLAGADMAQSSNPIGIYADAAKTAIQKLFGFDGIFGDYELSTTASKAYAVGETFIFNGNRYRAISAIAINDVIAPGTNCVLDPIDGRYVKKTDYATANTAGLVKPGSGIALEANTGKIYMDNASDAQIKSGAATNIAIPPFRQHTAAFYGLAKAAGADMASSSNAVGTYTDAAKAAIQTMLGIEADIPLVETVTGATASITGMPNVRYICDTAISELTITPPASGSIVVRFTAGSNCIVALPQTVKLPEWFDISSLEAGTTYEIIITDGVYGGVMSWA